MLFALKVWANGDKSEAILDSSELFKKRISGEREAIRDFWKETHVEPDNPDLWANYILMLPTEQVETALSGSRRVFLTHVNTPRQVVIGGDPLECQRIIAELKAPSLRAPFDHVLHCEAMAGEYPGILEMNIWPIWQDPGLRLYTADTYAPLVIEPEEIAASLSRMLCKPLDFPRLIHEVYQAGARIFVEVGAGSNCSRWISETLKDSPHLAVSLDRKGSDDAPAITRALARLACHHVPLNLEALFQPGRS
jgi:PfaB family protein